MNGMLQRGLPNRTSRTLTYPFPDASLLEHIMSVETNNFTCGHRNLSRPPMPRAKFPRPRTVISPVVGRMGKITDVPATTTGYVHIPAHRRFGGLAGLIQGASEFVSKLNHLEWPALV